MNKLDAVIDFEEMRRVMPHRYPFLLLDRVIEMELGKRIVGLKNVTINEQFFQGHFPDFPVMPGVLILEALAQASGVLAAKTANASAAEGSLLLFAGIDKARFRRQVVPGDTLLLEADLLRHKHDIWKFSTVARVGDEVACTAEMLCAIRRMDQSPA